MRVKASLISLLAVLLIAPFLVTPTFNEKVGSENTEQPTWSTPIKPIGAGPTITSPVPTSPMISASAIATAQSLKRNIHTSVSDPPPSTTKPTPRVTLKPKPTNPRPQKTPVLVFQGNNWQQSKASQYGGSDGFYYGHFACGGKYYPDVVGVAHKTIKCGTLIEFKHYNKALKLWFYARIRVVDRGPYCCGRDWDFTTKAAVALGFNGIGVVSWRYAK